MSAKKKKIAKLSEKQYSEYIASLRARDEKEDKEKQSRTGAAKAAPVRLDFYNLPRACPPAI